MTKSKNKKRNAKAKSRKANFKKKAQAQSAGIQDSDSFFIPLHAQAQLAKDMESSGVKDIKFNDGGKAMTGLFPVLDDPEGRTHIPMCLTLQSDGRFEFSF